MYKYLTLTILFIVMIIFLVIGIILYINERNTKRLATSNIQGTVIKYAFNDVMTPVVTYYVNNQQYKKRLRYTFVIKTSSIRNPIKSFTDDDLLSTSLHIKSNSAISFNTIIKDAFPIGSTMTVYYNPEKPKQAFVERYAKSYIPLIFMISAGVLIICFIILSIVF